MIQNCYLRTLFITMKSQGFLVLLLTRFSCFLQGNLFIENQLKPKVKVKQESQGQGDSDMLLTRFSCL